ncbi:MAG: hypothetical protein ACFFG0_43905 [Candidatus Thorarchaeota archaeon]
MKHTEAIEKSLKEFKEKHNKIPKEFICSIGFMEGLWYEKSDKVFINNQDEQMYYKFEGQKIKLTERII